MIFSVTLLRRTAIQCWYVPFNMSKNLSRSQLVLSLIGGRLVKSILLETWIHFGGNGSPSLTGKWFRIPGIFKLVRYINDLFSSIPWTCLWIQRINLSFSPCSALQEPSPPSAAAATCTERSKKDLEDELTLLIGRLKVSRDLYDTNKF